MAAVGRCETCQDHHAIEQAYRAAGVTPASGTSGTGLPRHRHSTGTATGQEGFEWQPVSGAKGIRTARVVTRSWEAGGKQDRSTPAAGFERHLPLQEVQRRLLHGGALCGVFVATEGKGYGQGEVAGGPGLPFRVRLSTPEVCHAPCLDLDV